MQLTVPFHLQTSRDTCMQACVKMLLDYHGAHISFEDISQTCRCAAGGTRIEDAAEFLSRVIRRPTLAYFDPRTHPGWYRGAHAGDILKNLKSRAYAVGWNVRQIHSLISFLAQGGIWSVTVISLGQLQRILRQKRPVIVGVEARLLWPAKKRERIEPVSHTVLVVGYTASGILFLDPAYPGGKVLRRNNSAFLSAWYCDGGIALYL